MRSQIFFQGFILSSQLVHNSQVLDSRSHVLLQTAAKNVRIEINTLTAAVLDSDTFKRIFCIQQFKSIASNRSVLSSSKTCRLIHAYDGNFLNSSIPNVSTLRFAPFLMICRKEFSCIDVTVLRILKCF